MVSTTPSTTTIQPNQWTPATWSEFQAVSTDPTLQNAYFYWFNNQTNIEMTPIGSAHSQDDSVVSRIINFFTTLKNIPIKELSNPSFRKPGELEFQPDLAYYIGDNLTIPPRGSSPIDLTQLPPPSLVIEIASTSLQDDLGSKRLIYETIGIPEYWVIDTKISGVIAFEIANHRSGRITTSTLLPGLELAIVEEALRRNQTAGDNTINRWLLELFSD